MAEQAPGVSPLLQQLVAESDSGGRNLGGAVGKLVFAVAVGWSLFQLWYASPLPFVLSWGVLNDTEARSLHLGIALFLAFLAYPAFKRSSRASVPVADWALAIIGAFAGAYFILFYAGLATRPGQPNTMDVVTASIGILILLEATRRAVGLPMTVLAILFLAYILFGKYLPDVLAHKGASWERMLSHQWLTTEGVFGVALGVSSAYIFIYVLFGSLLDRAGAGNYMMQVSFALLGHLRGGPAKVAVVSSALNGLISGSSVSNVVSGGIFTIPLMKKSGYGGVKAGAIETASSVNGQIMPPVMGAAAFLMVEYVGIPYTDIVKHAFLPAVISYIALFYIVHLEALKLGLQPMVAARRRTAQQKFIGWGLGVSGTIAVCSTIYFISEVVNSSIATTLPCETNSTKSVMRKPKPVRVMPPTMIPAVPVAMAMPIMLRAPSFRPSITSRAPVRASSVSPPLARKNAVSGRCVNISAISATVAQNADRAGESSSIIRHQISTPIGIRK
mgnify:CR=1 FL=1